MPSPDDKWPSSALSSTAWFLEKANFRADDRYAARYRPSLAAGANIAAGATRARTEARDPTDGGQPWRTAVADGVRAGRRDIARDRRYGADADALSGVLLLDRANDQ